VVPTWNDVTVHRSGTVRVHEDRDWLYDAVSRLTAAHEETRDAPWRPTDAPKPVIEGRLRGIVGLEITVTRVEGKTKLSQNRSEADHRGVTTGLAAEASV